MRVVFHVCRKALAAGVWGKKKKGNTLGERLAAKLTSGTHQGQGCFTLTL